MAWPSDRLHALPAALLLALAGTPTASPAAGALRGRVELAGRTLGGQLTSPAEAFVYLEDAPGPARPQRAPARILQKRKSFSPSFAVVPKGGRVAFENGDGLSHNVFSLAPGNTFDLGIYPLGQSREAAFLVPGVVPVYCNLHPQMIAYVAVVQNPFFARPAEDGSFLLEGIPPGEYTLLLWSPLSKPERTRVRIPASGEAQVKLVLRERGDRERHDDKKGHRYEPYAASPP